MDKITKMLSGNLQVASFGLQSFSDALTTQNVKVAHIDWKPPAGGDMKMLSMLSMLKGKKKL